MATYDRTISLTNEVSEIQKTVESIKQTQIIGNDNLVVNRYTASLLNQTILANITAVFKLTFTFDEQSTSYVSANSYFDFSVPTSYFRNFYADPLTVNDTLSRSWFLNITTTLNTTLNVSFLPECSFSGVASIIRIS